MNRRLSPAQRLFIQSIERDVFCPTGGQKRTAASLEARDLVVVEVRLAMGPCYRATAEGLAALAAGAS